MQSRIFGLIFAILISLTVFCGCGNSDPGVFDDEAGQSDSISNPEVEMITVADSQTTEFYIIRGDMADQSEISAAVKLRKALMEKSGADFGISTDWEKNPIYDHEIIVGKTEREDGSIDRIDLGKTVYIIKEENGKIFIAGGADEGTELAIDYFISTFVTGSLVEIPVGYERIVKHQYPIPEFYVNMVKIDNSRTILVPENAGKRVNSAAEKLQNVFYERTGIWLNIASDSSNSKPAFVVSDEKSSVNATHEIVVSDEQIVFKSSANSGVAACVEIFVNNYLTDKTGKFNFPSDFHYLDLGEYLVVSYPEN